ncbi:MAG: uroporphyrinogen-III synthase [Pseudomonadota bacterium]
MPPTDPILFLTRPRAASERFQQMCEARVGRALPVIIAPVIRIEHLADPVDLSGYEAVVFTSSNAVASAGQGRGRLAYCVGAVTAEVARTAGFDARSADGNADDLVALIRREAPRGRLLHLRGEHSQGDVAGRLTAAGFPTDERVVYRQTPQPIPQTVWADVPDGAELLLPVFSPFSAKALSATLPKGAYDITVIAISHAAAEHAPGPARALHVARRPDGAAMADEVAALYGPRAAC